MKKRTYLTPNEVADRLMVSPGRVRQWAQSGQLSASMTPGGHRRFLVEEVEKFADRQGLSLLANPGQDTLKILIIDDNVQLALYLEELLLGCEQVDSISIAHNGFSAGKLIIQDKPDLLLLDLMLPGLDGFTVCSDIKSDPDTSHIRVIAMTGYPSQKNIQRIIAAGAERCFAKPINEEELLQALGVQLKSTA